VVDDIRIVDELGDDRRVVQRLDRVVEPRPALEVPNVLDRTGR
jgi:hypothetical protein